MARIQFTELAAFVAVAEQRSFTRAAAQVGIAPPTMSQTIRLLEERLGVRLFNRTTRSVALTEAGARLLEEIQPILDGVDQALESVNAFREKPMGTLRLAVERQAGAILTAQSFPPLLQPFLAEYPAIRVEVSIEDRLIDIVSRKFDAGVRLGNRIERDMTILKLRDEFRLVTIASPAYLARRPAPEHPIDLHDHDCIGFRAPWDGMLQPWRFTRGDQTLEIDVAGPLIVNDAEMTVNTVMEGVGIGYIPEPMAAPHLAQGRLVALLQDWSPMGPGIYLYHPSRRQPPMPLQVFLRFVETWRKQVSMSGPRSA
jgi:DNA-binding transcriptional LysR family regulator